MCGYIKQAESDDPLTAGVWFGNAYFPDFYKADTNKWWGEMFDLMVKTYDDLEIDGVWLDMNEATSCLAKRPPPEQPGTLSEMRYFISQISEIKSADSISAIQLII